MGSQLSSQINKHPVPILLLVPACLLLSYCATSQNILSKAKEQSTLYNYEIASSLYKKAYDRKETIEAARGAAECYRKLNNYILAEAWYAKVIAMKEHTPEDVLNYAKVLINNARYEAAKEQLKQYGALKTIPADSSILSLLEGCDSALGWMLHPLQGRLVNLKSLNSSYADWGNFIYNDKIIFASDRFDDSLSKTSFFYTNNVGKQSYGWTGNNYLHLYEGTENKASGVKLLRKGVLNGDYHTASASLTHDGKEVFFAATRFVKKKGKIIGKELPYVINIEIFSSKWDSAGSNWLMPVAFPYNSIFNHSLGDPFISQDGQTLYFVSNLSQNGFGGTDIYYSKRSDSGWTSPVNVGAEINTYGNERSPFFDDTGNFYFASDGRTGMGGLDIYKAVIEKGKWRITNMGYPVNSPQDDFAPFVLHPGIVYFSSDRTGGKGSDDLYKFTIEATTRLYTLKLKSTILDKKNRASNK